MDLLKRLSDDHREIKQLLKRLDLTTERGSKIREKLFNQFKALLVAHSKSEEAVLYDRMKKGDPDARDAALEGYEEHHLANLLLKELTSLSKDHERWGAKLTVLKESLEHHIEEEEAAFFSKARKMFTRTELTEFNEEFATLFEAQKAGIGMPIRLVSKVARKIAS